MAFCTFLSFSPSFSREGKVRYLLCEVAPVQPRAILCRKDSSKSLAAEFTVAGDSYSDLVQGTLKKGTNSFHSTILFKKSP